MQQPVGRRGGGAPGGGGRAERRDDPALGARTAVRDARSCAQDRTTTRGRAAPASTGRADRAGGGDGGDAGMRARRGAAPCRARAASAGSVRWHPFAPRSAMPTGSKARRTARLGGGARVLRGAAGAPGVARRARRVFPAKTSRARPGPARYLSSQGRGRGSSRRARFPSAWARQGRLRLESPKCATRGLFSASAGEPRKSRYGAPNPPSAPGAGRAGGAGRSGAGRSGSPPFRAWRRAGRARTRAAASPISPARNLPSLPLQIKAAFRLLAKKCHPDLVSPAQRAEAERRFKQIAEAHAQLTHGARPVGDGGASERAGTGSAPTNLREPVAGEGRARARARDDAAGGARKAGRGLATRAARRVAAPRASRARLRVPVLRSTSLRVPVPAGNWHRTASGATYANNVRTAHTRRAWEAGGQHSPADSTRLSNTLLATILATPLIMTGVYLAKRADDDHTLSSLSWRPHGLLHPPHNPYLRDDLQERHEHKSSLPIFSWFNGTAAGAAQTAEAHGSASAQ